MERLTAEDQLMLWPDEIWPQDIGALAVLDGSGLLEPDGRFRIEQVRQAIESRLHLVPRFRQLLHVPRRGLGRPLWVDAPAFELERPRPGCSRFRPPATRRSCCTPPSSCAGVAWTGHARCGRCGSCRGCRSDGSACS